jgi:hypothetical protein
MTSPLSSIIRQLIANGYHPLPIAPDSKAPSEFRGGKWRGMGGWQKFRHEQPKDFLIKVWENWPDANIGIATGSSALAMYMVIAIDFDTDDYELLQEMEAALPYSSVRKRGRRGHTSFYLAPIGTKGFRTPIVELLTDTRQTVIPPSIHPDTGKPYIWLTADTLLNTPASALPVLTAEDIEKFTETVESLTKKPLKPVDPAAFMPVDENDSTFWRLLNNTAYLNLDMWVPELNLPKCRREGNGHYKAVAWWRPSSSGRDLNERSPNLSIAPVLGARDFGTGDRYTAINLVMHALAVTLDEAVHWLGTRVNLIPDAKFHVPPIKIEEEPAPAPQPTAGMAMEEVQVVERPVAAEAPAAPPDKPPERMLREFPEHLLKVPGLVGEIMDWIVDGARRPSRMLALGPALTIVGTTMGQGVRGPTRSATHLYVIGLAPSGAGKDHPLQAIGELMRSSTLGGLVGPSEFMSISSVINFLLRQSLSICAADEIGAFLKRLNNKNSTGHEQGVSKILRSIWGISFKNYMTPEWAARASVEIVNPAMSIYGVSTAEEYFESLQAVDVTNGFLNRFLVLSTNTKPAPREPLHDGTVPKELALKIVQSRNAAMQLGNESLERPIGAAREPKDMVWNGGRPVFEELEREIERISEDKMMESFFARAAENAIRMASIVAWGCGRTDVTREDMEWARDVAMWSANNMAASAMHYMSENDSQKMYQRVLRIVSSAPGGVITKRLLLQRLKGAVKSRDLEEFIKMALEAGEIEQDKSIPRRGGLPTISYRVPVK